MFTLKPALRIRAHNDLEEGFMFAWVLLKNTGRSFFHDSTLFGSARHVLNIIFKTEGRRSFLQGLGRDFLMMLLTAFMSVLAMSVAALLTLARTVGRHLPVLAPVLEPVWMSAAKLLTLVFLASLFYSLYRFAPARTLLRRALLIASLSGTFLFELTRRGFAWYVAFAQESPALYGALGGLIFFFLWLYYPAVAFVLGAEIALAYEQAAWPQYSE
jgi:membrane protein